jgi:hypothetical protein
MLYFVIGWLVLSGLLCLALCRMAARSGPRCELALPQHPRQVVVLARKAQPPRQEACREAKAEVLA